VVSVYGEIRVVTWRNGKHIDQAELFRDLVLMFESPAGYEFVIGRFSTMLGRVVFTTLPASQKRLELLGLDPWAPDFWTYAPRFNDDF